MQSLQLRRCFCSPRLHVQTLREPARLHTYAQHCCILCGFWVFGVIQWEQPTKSGKRSFISSAIVNFVGIQPKIDDYICLFLHETSSSTQSFPVPYFSVRSVHLNLQQRCSALIEPKHLHLVPTCLLACTSLLSTTIRQTESNLWNWNYFRVCVSVHLYLYDLRFCWKQRIPSSQVTVSCEHWRQDRGTPGEGLLLTGLKHSGLRSASYACSICISGQKTATSDEHIVLSAKTQNSATPADKNGDFIYSFKQFAYALYARRSKQILDTKQLRARILLLFWAVYRSSFAIVKPLIEDPLCAVWVCVLMSFASFCIHVSIH